MSAVVFMATPADRPITYEHGAIADNLLAGRGFSVWFLGSEGPTSQQAPWVPAMLALCSIAPGKVTPTSVVVFQLLQCLVGAATVAAVLRLAANLFPERPGMAWAVGWAAALFPPHVYMATHVQAAPWSIFGVTLLFALATNRETVRPVRLAMALGVVAGWLLLVDPIFVLILPVAAWQWLRGWQGRAPLRVAANRGAQTVTVSRRRTLAVAATCAALVVSPWILRNALVHGEFVFVKDTFGYAFWQGNNELSWGTDKIPKPLAEPSPEARGSSVAAQNRLLWEARHETLYIDDVLLKPSGYREFVGLTEPERSRLLGRRAWSFIVEHPAAYAELCLRRLRYFLLWDETNPKAMHPLYRLSSAIWLSLTAIGLLAARPQWKRLWPTMFAFALITLFHTLTITSARFRIPVEPLTFVWIAAGFAPTIGRIAERLARIFGTTDENVDQNSWPPSPGHALRGPHTRPGSTVSQTPSRLR